MNKYCMAVAILFLVSGVVQADETYICTYGQKERLIAIVYDDQSTRLPCEVRYTKAGSTETVWSASRDKGYCEEKAQGLVRQHLEWGWRCGGGEPGDTPQRSAIAPDEAKTIARYRRNAHIAQAISVTTMFRIEIMNYYMDHGRYPISLEELGHHREDMQNSAHISDLRVGDEGAILVKGNEDSGTDTVIVLKPRIALGGASFEWDCYINVKLDSTISCDYEQQLNF